MKWDFKTSEDRLNFGEKETQRQQEYLSFSKQDIIAFVPLILTVIIFVLYSVLV